MRLLPLDGCRLLAPEDSRAWWEAEVQNACASKQR